MLIGGSGADFMNVYCATKFVQLLGAHWWRRELAGKCDVVACSPGLIPGTGLGRDSGMKLTMDMPDAKPVTTGMPFTYYMNSDSRHTEDANITAQEHKVYLLPSPDPISLATRIRSF